MAIPAGPSTPGALTVLWAAKGGAGTSTVAAALALGTPGDTVLVDLDGDLPAVLGIPEPGGDGLADWLHTTSTTDTLDDLIVTVNPTTGLLPCGHTVLDRSSRRWPEFVTWAKSHLHVVVDAGTHRPPPVLHDVGQSVLVTRACYLALRHAVASPDWPDAVIVVSEPGRVLQTADIERALRRPVIAHVDVDPAIARAIDAGMLATRLPQRIENQLRPAMSSAPALPRSPASPSGPDGVERHAVQPVTSLERTEHGHRPVTVDVHVGAGLPGFQIHGIADARQRESRDRIRAAVVNSGLRWPDQRITIHIDPAGPVVDPHVDLAIAVGVLASTGQLDPCALDRYAYIGELGLDGTVRHPDGGPSPESIADLTGRPPAPTRHLRDLVSVDPAATPPNRPVDTGPATPGTPPVAVRPVDSPTHQILTRWQHPVPQTAPAELPHPLGGLA